MSQTIDLTLDGLSCGHCVKRVKESLEQRPDVEPVSYTHLGNNRCSGSPCRPAYRSTSHFRHEHNAQRQMPEHEPAPQRACLLYTSLVIAGDSVDTNGWRGQIHCDRAAGAIAITRDIRSGGSNGLRAAAQRSYICRRNADAPVAGSVQRGGIGFTV